MPVRKERGTVYHLLRRVTPLRMAVRKMREIVGRFRLPYWFLEGAERHGGQSLRLFYAGNLEDRNYIVTLAFADSYSDTPHGHMWLWSAFRRVRRGRDTHDLAIIDTEVPFARRLKGAKAFLIPGWIRGQVDLEVAARRCLTSTNVKTDLRKIRAQGYRYVVTREEREFERFYYTMYIPYAQRVYAGMAHLLSYASLTKAIDRCELLVVEQEGVAVAGQVLLHEGSRVRAWILGVKDGDPAYVNAGALAAAYYFEMQYLMAQGHRNLHLGGSRPFLRDGVLQYKKKWGMQIVDTNAKWFVMETGRYTEAVKSFLANNPFIFETQSGLCGAIFVTKDPAPEHEAVDGWQKDFGTLGIPKVRVFDLAKAGEPRTVQEGVRGRGLDAQGAAQDS